MTNQVEGTNAMGSVNTFYPRLGFLLALLFFTVGLTAQAQAQRTLTIKNPNGQTAGVIELADNAQVDLRVTTTGITLGMPVGVSFSCTGTTTANGSCDATAGAAPANNNGGAVADADSDGVADSSDQCPNTPSGEFANSAGCSPSQLDDDKDGVSNATDQCANTPSGTAVDGTGCPNQTTTTTTTSSSGAYCDGASASVTCSSSNTLDPWWEFSGDIKQTLNGDILSLPFTTRASTRDGGRVSFSTYESVFFEGEGFRAWISETPGGRPLRTDTACNQIMAQARGGLYWTQNSDYENYRKVCYLGTKERVLYMNFEACVHNSSGLECVSERVRGYRFDVRRNYSPI